MAVQELTGDDFDDETANGAWVIDFWADWCGPCKKMKPIFEDLSDDFDDINFGSVNVDEEQEVAGQFQVRSIPTFLYIEDGDVQDTAMGAMTEDEFRDWLEEKA
ncbi:MAG: thioredoxin [Candidatus Nanohaloarchaea archaeon]|nr:thioredoxin [Candidatus Nanohaloarchaea archaeon]